MGIPRAGACFISKAISASGLNRPDKTITRRIIMRVVKSRETYSNKKAVSGISNPIPTGNLKPHNCKTSCPYGNGTTFCFPCMAKIMDEKRKKDAARVVQDNAAELSDTVSRQTQRISEYGKKISEVSAASAQTQRIAAYAGRLAHE